MCVKLWSTSSWKNLVTVKVRSELSLGDAAEAILTQCVRVWVQAHDNFVTVVAFDAPGLKFLSAGDDQTVRVWHLPRKPTPRNPPKEILRIQDLQVPCLPPRSLMGCSSDDPMMSNHAPMCASCVTTTHPRKPQSTVIAADFSEDGSRVVGVLAGKQIFVWHATTGTALIWWQFSPFDTTVFADSLWRTGTRPPPSLTFP